jgi:tRNA pseudouridine55 synthase
MTGALVVDKPAGPTSHDVVACARRALGERRIGHTGTLDPLATGVLVLLVGGATRLARFLSSDEKEYAADIRLGVATPTYDAESLREADASTSEIPPDAEIDRALDEFRGTFLQTPPPYSAKKIAGKPAYVHARREAPTDLKPVEVTIRELERLPSQDPGVIRLRLVSTAGFYVRSLAHDLGRRLGCGGHLASLRRTRAGTFRVEDAIPLDLLAERPDEARARMLPPERLLGALAEVVLTGQGVDRAAHGGAIGPAFTVPAGAGQPSAGPVRLMDAAGRVVAVAERRPDGLLHPLVVMR